MDSKQSGSAPQERITANTESNPRTVAENFEKNIPLSRAKFVPQPIPES
jgi:hypothetical protein